MRPINNLYTLLVIACLATGCATVISAPKRAVPKRQELHQDAFGGWMTAHVQHTPTTIAAVSGELIAITDDSICMMAENGMVLFAKSDIASARVVFYNTAANTFGAWTAALSIGTISNGVFAIGTFPLALIAGIATSSGESKRINYYDYPAEDWSYLRRFARFPQGLPAAVNRNQLEPRPVLKK